MNRLAIIAIVVASGCYEAPDYADTRFRCGENSRCPNGYTCLHGACERGVPTDGRTDAQTIEGILCDGTRCAIGDVCCVYLGSATCKPPGQGPCARTATCDFTSDTCGIVDICCQTPNGADCVPWLECQSTYVCEGPGDATCWNTPKCCASVDGPWGVCGSC